MLAGHALHSLHSVLRRDSCFLGFVSLPCAKKCMSPAADIFEKAGFGAGKDATGVSVLLGFFKLVMTGGPSIVC